MAFMPTRGGRGPSTPIIFVPTLNDLVLSGALVAGVASAGTILNATTGSTITSSVPGLTVNSAARTYSYNGAGSAGSVQGLVETLAGATFSPRNNAVAIVSASIPAFTSNPSITPSSGDQNTTFSASDGAMSNGGAVLSARWLLNGTSIGSGTTIVPGAPGSLVRENTGTGNVTATSTAVTVAAAGTPTPTPSGSVGGTALGTVGTSGPETGMTLVYGDDFDGTKPDLYGPAPENRFGRYGTDRAPYVLEAALQSLRTAEKLGGVDGDPLWTGHEDSNRGNVITSMADLITQANSRITLRQRDMVAGEAAHVNRNNRSVMSSMIHTALDALLNAPGVYEWEEQLSVHPKSHPSGWSMQGVAGSDEDNECDKEAGSHQDGTGDGRTVEFNNNVWVNRGRSSSRSGGSSPITVDWSVPHRFKIAYTEIGDVEYYMDDVLKWSQTTERTKTLQEAHMMLWTMHMYNVSGRTGTDEYNVNWYRVWSKNGAVAPKMAHQTIQVAFGEGRTVDLPNQTALWGRSVTEKIQAMMPQPGEPGGTTNGVLYGDLPPGMSKDLSVPSSPKLILDNTLVPGRVTVVRWVNENGFFTRPHRYVVEIGPRIDVSDFTVTQGVPFSLDVYPLVKCGTLVVGNDGKRAKTITVTGLPSGLTFNGDAIVGTTTAATGERTITINATNSVGQAAPPKQVKLNLVAQPVDNTYAYQALASLVGDFDASRDAGFAAQTGEISTWGNAVASAGDLSSAPTVSVKPQRIASQLGGRPIIRFTKGSDGATSTVLETATGTTLSGVATGADFAFTQVSLFKPLSGQGTGLVAGWSEQVSGTIARNTTVIRRSGSASTFRNGLTNSTNADVAIGTLNDDAWTLVVARHTGGITDVWVNKVLVASAAANPSTTTWTGAGRFSIGNLQGNTGLASRYPGTAFAGDIAQIIAFNAALTDAQITQMMNDIYGKWGLT